LYNAHPPSLHQAPFRHFATLSCFRENSENWWIGVIRRVSDNMFSENLGGVNKNFLCKNRLSFSSEAGSIVFFLKMCFLENRDQEIRSPVLR
jgi:hypothetical protein